MARTIQNAEEYAPFIEAFKAHGIELSLVETGGGCRALWMATPNGAGIYALGDLNDPYYGFEVTSPPNGDTVGYEPVDPYQQLSPEQAASLLAPALHRYLTGDKDPLPGWHVEEH